MGKRFDARLALVVTGAIWTPGGSITQSDPAPNAEHTPEPTDANCAVVKSCVTERERLTFIDCVCWLSGSVKIDGGAVEFEIG